MEAQLHHTGPFAGGAPRGLDRRDGSAHLVIEHIRVRRCAMGGQGLKTGIPLSPNPADVSCCPQPSASSWRPTKWTARSSRWNAPSPAHLTVGRYQDSARNGLHARWPTPCPAGLDSARNDRRLPRRIAGAAPPKTCFGQQQCSSYRRTSTEWPAPPCMGCIFGGNPRDHANHGNAAGVGRRLAKRSQGGSSVKLLVRLVCTTAPGRTLVFSGLLLVFGTALRR